MTNTLYLAGRLGKPPQLSTKDNSLKAIINLAVSPQDNQNQNPIWFNGIEFKDKAAEKVSGLNKGDQIALRGIVSHHVWQNSDKRSSRIIISVDDPQQIEILNQRNSVASILSLPQPPEPCPLEANLIPTQSTSPAVIAAPIIPEDLTSRINF